jgi:hypothetical protein
VGVRVAVRVVPVVRLIAFRFPGSGLRTTTMEHRGGQDDDDGAWVQLFWGEGWGGCGVFGDG